MDRPAGRDRRDPDGRGWPVAFNGVTETIVATPNDDGGWNQAAFGVHAGDPPWGRSWGETTTHRNLTRAGTGVMQFPTDPIAVVEAALGTYVTDGPVLTTAAAWVSVEATVRDRGTEDGTTWTEWVLTPGNHGIRERTVPTLRRARTAVIEAAVAASRLDVDAYDHGRLKAVLNRAAATVDRTGTERERAAVDRIATLTDWTPA